MSDYTTSRTMMVDTQVRPSDVTKFPIIDAMLRVRREMFVPAALRDVAYVGDNIDLGDGRVVLEPRTFAKMLDALEMDSNDLVLDLGCGMGYSSAVLARMCEAVVAVEEDADMAADAETTLLEQGIDNVAVITGPLRDGAPQHGPYDVIIVQGAVEHIPEDVTSQIKQGGKIAAIFAQGRFGVCRIGHRIDGRITWRRAFDASAPVLAGFTQDQAFKL